MRSFRAASGNLSSRAQPRDLLLPLVRARFQPCRFGPHKNLSSRPARPGFFLRTLFVRRVAERRDTALAKRVGMAMGKDARARGVHIILAPGMNIYRAPMNGRNFEYFGEV